MLPVFAGCYADHLSKPPDKEETVAGWITGSADIDAEWDAYVSYMISLGAESVLGAKLEQSNRFFASAKESVLLCLSMERAYAAKAIRSWR